MSAFKTKRGIKFHGMCYIVNIVVDYIGVRLAHLTSISEKAFSAFPRTIFLLEVIEVNSNNLEVPLGFSYKDMVDGT